jgi:hypothetical protein
MPPDVTECPLEGKVASVENHWCSRKKMGPKSDAREREAPAQKLVSR